ncbi:MAG: glycosyltransferase [Patescibacteria group bacterium]|jgi:glycosyltransferase involved in cell wall biosynthesis
MITAIFAIKNRDRQRAENCIDSLMGQDTKIIVVDYGSDDLSWYGEVFRCGWISVKRDTEDWNKSRAYNIGLRLVTTPYVVFSDIDNIFADNFIDRVKEEVVKEKSAVLCQCEDLDKQGNVYRLHPKTGYGACFGIDTNWVTSVGGYDETYTYWGNEDTDIAKRASQSGYNLVWLEPLIKHQHHENAPRPTLDENRRYFEKKKPIIRNQPWGEI